MVVCQNSKIVGTDAPKQVNGLTCDEIQKLTALINKANKQQDRALFKIIQKKIEG